MPGVKNKSTNLGRGGHFHCRKIPPPPTTHPPQVVTPDPARRKSGPYLILTTTLLISGILQAIMQNTGVSGETLRSRGANGAVCSAATAVAQEADQYGHVYLMAPDDYLKNVRDK